MWRLATPVTSVRRGIYRAGLLSPGHLAGYLPLQGTGLSSLWVHSCPLQPPASSLQPGVLGSRLGWLQHRLAIASHSTPSFLTVPCTVQCDVRYSTKGSSGAVQYSTVQCSAEQYSAVQSGQAVQYSIVQGRAVQCSVVYYSAYYCSPVQSSQAVQWSAAEAVRCMLQTGSLVRNALHLD